MYYYLVYFLNYKNLDKNMDELVCRAILNSRKEAIQFLSQYAIEYIQEYQGKQQAEICIQYDKTMDEIANDPKLKEGYYLGKNNDTIILYEKVQHKIAGTLWNSYEIRVNKVGAFNVAEIEISTMDNTKPIILPPTPLNSTSSKNYQSSYTYLDELKTLFDSKSFGLKPIK